MDNKQAITQASRLVSRLDGEIETLDDHGGNGLRYVKLERVMMQAELRLYRRRVTAPIRMAQVPVAYGVSELMYGPPLDVEAALHIGLARYGRC